MHATSPTLERTRRWPRPYASTWVFMGFLTVVLGLLNVPGQEITEPDMVSGPPREGAYFSTYLTLHHGWPMTAVVRATSGIYPPRVSSVWNLTDDVVAVEHFAIAVDAGVAAGILVLGGFLFQTWRTRRGTWRQFRLAELMGVVLLVAIGVQRFAAERAAARAERSALDEIEEDSDVWSSFDVQPAGPTWLRQLLGDSLFDDRDRAVELDLYGSDIRAALPLQRLKVIHVHESVTTAELELLNRFPDLVAVDLSDAPGGPSGVGGNDYVPHKIPRLAQLRGLKLYGTNFSGDGLENLPRLEVLDLSNTYVADDDLKNVARMRNLRELDLFRTNVTSTGLAQLCDLPNLRALAVGSWAISERRWLITDAAVPSLSRLRHLQRLTLYETKITTTGFAALRAALPNCEIHGD